MDNKIYVINGQVAFAPDDACIYMWGDESENTCGHLTALPGRLLDYLLKNSGRTLSRDELLTAVWEAFGIPPSGHSLNQNISLLRRLIIEYGLSSEVIRTIPREGYTIDPELVEVIDIPPPMLTLPQINTESRNEFNTKKGYAQWAFRFLAFMVAAFFLMTLANHFYYLLNSDEEHFTEVSLIKLMALEGCIVYTLPNGSAQLNRMKQYIKDKGFPPAVTCMDNAIYLFHADDAFLFNQKGRVFISLCTKSHDTPEKYAGCEYIYAHEYRSDV